MCVNDGILKAVKDAGAEAGSGDFGREVGELDVAVVVGVGGGFEHRFGNGSDVTAAVLEWYLDVYGGFDDQGVRKAG